MSKVSIIVPYLKGPSYLEECIQSIENQKLSDYEILLVDDKDGHDVPETVLAMKNVRHIVVEEELDADSFFETKSEFFEERARNKLGLTKEEYEVYKQQHEQLQTGQAENDMNETVVNTDTPFEGELEIQLRPFGVAVARNLGVRQVFVFSGCR